MQENIEIGGQILLHYYVENRIERERGIWS